MHLGEVCAVRPVLDGLAAHTSHAVDGTFGQEVSLAAYTGR
jgi:hypothetical protein